MTNEKTISGQRAIPENYRQCHAWLALLAALEGCCFPSFPNFKKFFGLTFDLCSPKMFAIRVADRFLQRDPPSPPPWRTVARITSLFIPAHHLWAAPALDCASFGLRQLWTAPALWRFSLPPSIEAFKPNPAFASVSRSRPSRTFDFGRWTESTANLVPLFPGLPYWLKPKAPEGWRSPRRFAK